MVGFLLAAAAFFFGVNGIGAAVYAGIPPMSQGGFISFSPAIDIAAYLLLMAVAALCALAFRKKFLASGFSLTPSPWSYPIAYLLALAGLSLVVDLLGLCRVLYQYSPIHLPFFGYVALLIVLYLGAGFLLGKRLYHGPASALLWGVGIALALALLGLAMISQADLQDAPYQAQILAGSYIPGYTGRLMRSGLGNLLGRINLPACVVMGNYEYAFFENLGGVHSIPRNGMTLAVCLAPPLLFTAGWLGAGLTKRLQQRNEATR